MNNEFRKNCLLFRFLSLPLLFGNDDYPSYKPQLMEEDIKQCIQVLRDGGIILYPTDTIWGIGCDATNAEAVKKIYKLRVFLENNDIKANFNNFVV